MLPDVTRRRFVVAAGLAGTAVLAGCAGGDAESEAGPAATTTASGAKTTDAKTPRDQFGLEHDIGRNQDPASAPRAKIDRFSDAAGTTFVRTEENGLPGPNEPVDFDQPPFLTQGLGPEGEAVRYYNFDAQPTRPAPIYVLYRADEETPVEDQLDVIDVLPGEEGYSDVRQVHRVTVPTDYEANSVTGVSVIEEAGFEVTPTDTLVNCPVVPDGSTAIRRFGDGSAELLAGWYNNFVVFYFEFTEAPLSTTDDSIPVSPIYVTFNRNPGAVGGGPSSGFRAEMVRNQTHNVVAALPDDEDYSPLWLVNVYDNDDFDDVTDLDSATDAELLAPGVATVNCPIVSVE